MINILISISALTIVIVFHEMAHAYVAYLLGDNTAKNAGRLTLNPIAHVDLVGTIIIPILLIISRSPVLFGWAKPVPINPHNFRNRRKGIFLTSLAGPAANFILAALFAILFKTGLFKPYSIVWTFLLNGIIISLILGIFNMLPIPPLDGAGVLSSVLPPRLARSYDQLNRYGFIIIIGLLYLGLFDKIILPLVRTFTKVLLG